MYVVRNAKFLYVRPPKTGSTSVFTALGQLFPGLQVIEGGMHAVGNVAAFSGYFAMLSVRSPYTRATSYWRFCQRARMPLIRVKTGQSPPQRQRQQALQQSLLNEPLTPEYLQFLIELPPTWATPSALKDQKKREITQQQGRGQHSRPRRNGQRQNGAIRQKRRRERDQIKRDKWQRQQKAQRGQFPEIHQKWVGRPWRYPGSQLNLGWDDECALDRVQQCKAGKPPTELVTHVPTRVKFAAFKSFEFFLKDPSVRLTMQFASLREYTKAIGIDHLVHLETMRKDLLGLPMVAEKLKKLGISEQGFHVEWKRSSKYDKPWNSYYTPELVALVRDVIWPDDFTAFGYPKDFAKHVK